VITLVVYTIGIGCIALATRHRLDAWAMLHATKGRVRQLSAPLIAPRDVTTTLSDLARALRSGHSLRTSLIDEAQRPGSILPESVVGRLTRGDVLRDVCRDELHDIDARLRRAFELADLSGVNAPEILDVAADSIRQEHGLALLAESAGSHSRSTVSVLTVCSVLAAATSAFFSSSVRQLLTSPVGVILITVGVGCNIGARLWIGREIARSTRGDGSTHIARDIILTLESLVLAGYSLQGALMTAHTWLHERSVLFTQIAERLHAGHTVEATLHHLEHACDDHVRGVVHGLRVAHLDGGPIHTSLKTIRQEITQWEEHRLTAAIQRTPVRLVVPLVGCALPSFLCIGVIPVLVAIVGGLSLSNGV
jgi:tight adherence protein B